MPRSTTSRSEASTTASTICSNGSRPAEQIVAKEEIYDQVIHFYQENLDPGAKISAHVVCTTRAELTEEDKREAYQEALRKYQADEYARIQANANKPKVKPKTEAKPQASLSLFDF